MAAVLCIIWYDHSLLWCTFLIISLHTIILYKILKYLIQAGSLFHAVCEIHMKYFIRHITMMVLNIYFINIYIINFYIITLHILGVCNSFRRKISSRFQETTHTQEVFYRTYVIKITASQNSLLICCSSSSLCESCKDRCFSDVHTRNCSYSLFCKELQSKNY